MQQIERYGVIALVFFLITIVAVSFWGDSKSPGFWSRLTGSAKKDATVDQITPPPSSTDGALTPPAPLDLDPKASPLAGNTGTSTGTGLPAAPQSDAQGQGIVAAPSDVGTSAGPVAITAPPAATNEYVVQRGDSLALIARRTLGKESRWTEIAALNPGLTPKNLKVGAKLAMPGDATASVAQPAPKKITPAPKAKPEVAAAPEKKLASAHTCKVQKGDTLKAIARRELGDGERWQEIADLNPGVTPSKLAVGQVLRLPGGTRAVERPMLVADAGPVSNKPRIR